MKPALQMQDVASDDPRGESDLVTRLRFRIEGLRLLLLHSGLRIGFR